MQPPTEMQAQIRSLSIPKDQRPVSHARGERSRALRNVLILLILGGGGWTAYHYRAELATTVNTAVNQSAKSDDPNTVRLMTVALGKAPEPGAVLTATGKIVSDHRVAVSTKVSGQITALFFEQGDRVEKGQLLATVEDVLPRARRDEAAARLERSQATLDYQKINFERVSSLVKVESAPSIEFADAKRAIGEWAAQVEADKATLTSAEKTLADCRVVAPIAGVILQRNVEVGDFVAAEGGLGAQSNAQFATIADMSMLRVEVDISELDIIRIHQGMPCTITPDAYKDRRYHGSVMWIDPGANYSKATVQAKVRIEQPDAYLRVEGSAQVAFLTEAPKEPAAEDHPAIWIPEAAIMSGSDGAGPSVFLVSDGRLKRVPVVPGRRTNGQVEITSGLSPGDSIAVEGVDKIREGQRVKG